MPDATEDDISVLAIVVDCGPSWSQQRAHEQWASVHEQLLIFANAYQLLSASNLLLVIGTHPSAVEVLWPPPSAGIDAVAAPGDAHELRESLVTGFERLAGRQLPIPSSAAPLLSAALAAALCRLQRICREQPKVQPRLLVLSATEDSPSQHLASMNCIFAAQKLGVLIDAVVIGSAHHSMVLQQAAHLTGGLYLRPDATMRRALAQHLITCCLPDRFARQYVRAPQQSQLETRALCYVTKRPVEIGHACSVCLTVFSQDDLNPCPVCNTRFKVTVLPPAKKKAKKVINKDATSGSAVMFRQQGQ